MKRMTTDFIAIHCSATKPSVYVDENIIRQWHLDRGWADIGYNVVIKRDGVIQIGRPLDDVGAHVEKYNRISVGVCLVGGLDENGSSASDYTPEQWAALKITLRFLKAYAPEAHIQGHRDFPNVDKNCPCFDVRMWLAQEMPELL